MTAVLLCKPAEPIVRVQTHLLRCEDSTLDGLGGRCLEGCMATLFYNWNKTLTNCRCMPGAANCVRGHLPIELVCSSQPVEPLPAVSA